MQRVRRKIEQRKTLLAQAELRETRTRRKTKRPDYVYSNGIDSQASSGNFCKLMFGELNRLHQFETQDDADDYNYEDDASNDYGDEDSLNFRANGSRPQKNRNPSLACRRSTRAVVLNANGKRESSSDSWQWRERRSTRQAAKYGDVDLEEELPRKRSRTAESMESGSPGPGGGGVDGNGNGVRVKVAGAAALKPTEIAIEQIAGKKKSKYWVYAIEPMQGDPINGQDVTMQPSNHDRLDSTGANGIDNGNIVDVQQEVY